MDLSAIINNEGVDDKAAALAAQQPATPSSSSAHLQSRHASSANANKLYNEYSSGSAARQSQHDLGRNPSPYEYEQSRQQGRHASSSAEYHAQSRTPLQQFASPTATYQRPALHSATAPLAQANHELLSRSPRSAASYPSQSPLFPRTSSGPFTYQPTNSPGQERNSIAHQASGRTSLQRQETYPQPSISQYLTSPVPQTPPSAVGSSAGYPPFLQTQQQQHSRSHSAHSNSTPTSAHSQYTQSPLLASAYPAPPQAHRQAEQRSQPGTPLGPPISIHRSGTYPPHQQQYPAEARLSRSPYQSRQSLPPPPAPPSLQQTSQQYEQRNFSGAEERGIYTYDGQQDPRPQSQSQQILQAHRASLQEQQQAPYGERRRRPREESLSVSPKTTPLTRISQEAQNREPVYAPEPQRQPQIQEEENIMSRDTEARDRTELSAKRKMDRQSTERSEGRGSEPPMQRQRIHRTPDTAGETTDEISPEQLRHMSARQGTKSQTPQPQPHNKRPQSEDSQREERPRKRKRYTNGDMPIWARSWPEFIKFKKAHPGGTFYGVPVGDIGGPAQSSTPQVNGDRASSRPPAQQPAHTNGAVVAPITDDISALLGVPFAPNISTNPPPSPLTKSIADFFYLTVIDRSDWNQLSAHKIQIEIEAKLGTLIDKGTNQRLELPVASECVLAAGFGGTQGKVAFRSEMQEDVFRKGNQYLNEMTKLSMADKLGVPIAYSHRREVDSFHHLSPAALNELPPSMQHYLNTPATRSRGLKVRVSRDQKTGKEIARIVKARVADLDLYFPNSQLDCRISVNLEMEFEGDLPIDAGVQKPANDDEGDRRKDRLSYKQSGYTIDLTQVSSGNAPPTHELEIEIDTNVLVQQGRRLVTQERHAYVEFVEGLVGRVRSLIGELGQ